MLFVLACNFSVSLTQIAGFGGITLWLIQTYRSRSWNRTKWILGWPFTILFLVGLLSILNGVEPLLSLPYLKKLALCLLFFWTMNALDSTQIAGLLSWLAKYLKPKAFQNKVSGWINLIRKTPSSIILINLLIFCGTLSACIGLIQAFSIGVGLGSRGAFHGTLSNIITFSTILMMVGIFSLARLILSRQRTIGMYLSSFIILACLLLTLTREVWLGTIFGIALLVFMRKKILVAFLPLFIALVYFISPPFIQDRVLSITDFDDASIHPRLEMWAAGLEVIKDRPWIGCGYKCLYLIYDQYPQHPILQKFYFGLHNNPIQIAVDSGLLGLGAWLGLWVAYLIAVYREHRKLSPHGPPEWVFGASVTAVLSFLTAGLFETNFYDSEVVMVLYFIMALPFVDSNSAKPVSSNPRSPSTSR